MARPPSDHPTEAELRILKVLWQESPKTVDEVRQILAAEDRDLTHSSVITLMNIMVRKGYLKREKRGRAFEFTPLVESQKVGRNLLGDLVQRVYDGSAHSVMLELLESHKIDSDEIKEIRKLINRIAKERG
jgi:predicted transcriptional regulator